MRIPIITFASLFIGLCAVQAEEQPAAKPERFRDHTPAEFRKLEEAKQEINPAAFDEELLAAAIFHETNARRVELELPALKFHPQVRDAALAHAKHLAKHKYLSHGTPEKDQNTTPSERLAAQGLQVGFSAENVAFNFAIQLESGRPFHTREEGGRPVYSYEAGGRPLPRHSYTTFAEAILKQWMESPGHRQNIVAKDAEFLGVGSALSKSENGVDTIFCNQSFFTPLPEEMDLVVPSL